METALTITFGAIGIMIVVAALGVAIYKWKNNTMANLKSRKKKY